LSRDDAFSRFIALTGKLFSYTLQNDYPAQRIEDVGDGVTVATAKGGVQVPG
jgi:hypothetical protein